MPHPYLIRDAQISALARELRFLANLGEISAPLLWIMALAANVPLADAPALLPEAVTYERARRRAFRLA